MHSLAALYVLVIGHRYDLRDPLLTMDHLIEYFDLSIFSSPPIDVGVDDRLSSFVPLLLHGDTHELPTNIIKQITPYNIRLSVGVVNWCNALRVNNEFIGGLAELDDTWCSLFDVLWLVLNIFDLLLNSNNALCHWLAAQIQWCGTVCVVVVVVLLLLLFHDRCKWMGGWQHVCIHVR